MLKSGFTGLRCLHVGEEVAVGLPIDDIDRLLNTDASDNAIGSELSQIQKGEDKTICFASKVLTPAQRKY